MAGFNLGAITVKPLSASAAATTDLFGKPITQPATTSTATGMSASTANATPAATTGYTPSATAPNLNQSQLGYFDNKYGGIDSYAANQNNRYAQAVQSGNTDLMNKLAADSQRVGYGLSYQQAQPAQATPQANYPGMNDAVTNVQSSGQLQQYAQDQTAIDRAALLNAINTQMESLKNNANYSNQLIKDNRVLEDQALLRNKNPFSGATNYQLSQVQRGRSIDDTSRAAQLDNTLNSLSTEIANFDKLTPERQRAIYQELLAAERNFGLNVGQLTGNYGNQRTLAGAQQDWGQQMDLTDRLGYLPNSVSTSGGNNSAALNALSSLAGVQTLAGRQMDMNEAALTGTYKGNKTADQLQREWQNRFEYGNAIGQFSNGQKTTQQQQIDRSIYENDRNYNEDVRRYNQDFQYTQGRDKAADAKWQAEFDRIAQQDGIQNALAWANYNLNSAEFDDSSARSWVGLEWDMKKADNQAAEVKSTFTPTQVYNSVKEKYAKFLNPPQFGQIAIPSTSDYEAMYQDVIKYGLPEGQEDDILRSIGLTDAQISSFDKKYLSGN